MAVAVLHESVAALRCCCNDVNNRLSQPRLLTNYCGGATQ